MKGERRSKTRMISFRVSEKEFEQVRKLTEVQGAESVSKFARVAICGAVEGSEQENTLSGDIRQLREDVRRLRELIEDTRRPAANGNSASREE